MFDEELTQKRVSLISQIEDFSLTANEEMLNQVWVNLIDNALKFTPPGGMIRVTVRRHQGLAIVVIEDSGDGIDEEARQHIFDKFYQADRSHAMKGNGIGLTLVKRIVDLHQGNITCESTVGRGTIFVIWLPIA